MLAVKPAGVLTVKDSRVSLDVYKRQRYSTDLGELQLNEKYFLVNHMLGEGALYNLNYTQDINVTFDIIGEGNCENADICLLYTSY